MLVLSRRDVLDLLSLRECIDAVERAFRLHAAGDTLGPVCRNAPRRGLQHQGDGLAGAQFFAPSQRNFRDTCARRLPPFGTVVSSTRGPDDRAVMDREHHTRRTARPAVAASS